MPRGCGVYIPFKTARTFARSQVKGTRRYQAAQRAFERLESAPSLIAEHSDSPPPLPLSSGLDGRRRRPRPLSALPLPSGPVSSCGNFRPLPRPRSLQDGVA